MQENEKEKQDESQGSTPFASGLEIMLGQLRAGVSIEQCKSLSLLSLASRLEQAPFNYRDKKGRIKPKKYSSAYNSLKLLNTKTSESRKNLKKIALDYAWLKKEISNQDNEQLKELANNTRTEIKEKLVSIHRNSRQSQELINNAGLEFFNKSYEMINNDKFELCLHKKRSKFSKAAAIAALSLFLGGAGITGLYKANVIQLSRLSKQKPGIEQTIEQEPRINAYERIHASEFTGREDAFLVPGKVPILMYHKIGTPEDRFTVSPGNFRRHLQGLYENGFQLISLENYINNDFSSLKPGKKAAIITFDDADQGQFEIAKYKNKLVYDEFSNPVIDPDCSVGIITDFCKQHPDFGKSASYFIDFVDKDHKEQAPFMQEELVKLKLNYLLKEGFEVCNHTYSHPDMKRLSLNDVKREEARFDTAIEYYLGENSCLVKDILAFPYGSMPEDKKVVDYINRKYKTFSAWGGAADMHAGMLESNSPPRIEVSTNLERDVLSKRNVLYKARKGGD